MRLGDFGIGLIVAVVVLAIIFVFANWAADGCWSRPCP